MGKLIINDENGTVAHITIAYVKQSNDALHVIDKVVLPKTKQTQTVLKMPVGPFN